MKKCEKCGKPAKVLNSTLTNGINGFRRYKLCPNCIAKISIRLSKKFNNKEKATS